jgi:hypothetical protein
VSGINEPVQGQLAFADVEFSPKRPNRLTSMNNWGN